MTAWEVAAIERLSIENARLRAAAVVCEVAITGYLSMGYSAAESTRQLAAARDELRRALVEKE